MKSLKVLDDLTVSFKNLGIFSSSYENKIRKEIVVPFREDLKKILESVDFISLDVIHDQTNLIQRNQHYLVTLENGVYFPNYDYSFNLTRTALNKKDFRSGPYLLYPRSGYPPLEDQAQSLAADYKKKGESKPIVICDDSIGKYGYSIKAVIELISKHGLQVSQIYVIVNVNDMKTLLDIKIESFLSNAYLINERDLFWGLPKSGISCIKDSQMSGIPSTIDNETIISRSYKLPVEKVVNFKICVYEYNIKFWQMVENYFNHKMYFSDCPRLKGIPDFLEIPNERIIDFLRKGIESIKFNDL